MGPGVATIVVTYHSDEHVGACVASAPGRVWVMDNSPQRGTIPADTPFEHHPENLGFAGAVNRGFALTEEPLVLLLNPDCVVQGGVEAMIAEFATQPKLGAAGGLLLDAVTGKPQQGFIIRRFPTAFSLAFELLGLNRLLPDNPVNRRYRCLDVDLEKPQAADQPAGAFLMIRRAAFDAVGGFDEGFFPVWFEDVDFCKRLKTAGWEVRYTPGAVARHKGGHSVSGMPVSSKTVAWYGSLQRYAVKHMSRPGRWLVALAMIGSALPRGVAGVLQAGSLSPFGVQLRATVLAVKRLVL